MSKSVGSDRRLKRTLALVQHYKDTFQSSSGKIVLFDLLKSAGVLGTSLVPGDPYSTHYNEGSRSVGLYIMKQIGTSEQDLLDLIERGKKHERDLFPEDTQIAGG
jgi:hypothetical protein